jgi:hypothetical protein
VEEEGKERVVSCDIVKDRGVHVWYALAAHEMFAVQSARRSTRRDVRRNVLPHTVGQTNL